MRKKITVFAAMVGAALLAGGAGTAHAAAACGDINNSGGTPNSIDSVGLAQALLGGSVASHCGNSGTLQCGDIVKDNTLNSQDLVASLQIAANIPTLLAPCTGFGSTLPCNTNIQGTITTNTVFPADCDTFIDGTVIVQNGAVVTVQPGATIKGRKTSFNNTPSALVISRGSKINAGGTPAKPIVMTSDQAPGSRNLGVQGDWGGLVLLGSAPVNFPGGEGASEGLPPGTANFGGNNPNDSSGQVRYTRIEFSGRELAPDNELNVLTQNGIGAGTTMEYIQANAGTDDGVEWFGGTVTEKHIVVTNCEDDNLDWQIGYRGNVQFYLAYQNAATDISSGSNGIEADNNEEDFLLTPVSNPNVCNVTMIGCRKQGCATGGAGANLRRGTAGKVANTIITDWFAAALDIDDDATLVHGCTNSTTLNTTEPVLRVQDSILYNAGSLVSGSTTSPNCTPAQLVGLWGMSLSGTDPLPGVTGTYPTTVDDRFFPVGGGIADNKPDCADLNTGVFDPAPYAGAFVPGGSTGSGDNWLVTPGGWISFAAN